MSELPKIVSGPEAVAMAKYGGLPLADAYRRAVQLLSPLDVQKFLTPYLCHSKSVEEIALGLNVESGVVSRVIDELEVLLAERHLQNSFGHPSQILELIEKTERALRGGVY